MRIGVDLDGVVTNFVDAVNPFLADWTDSEPVVADNWNWFLGYPNGMDAWRAMWEWVEETHVFAMLQPYEQAVSSLLRLQKLGHELTFMTHRPSWAAADTQAWLKKHGLDAGTELVLVERTDHKALLPADVVLDDLPETVASCKAAGKTALLFRRPWNTEAWETQLSVTRWPQFVAYIKVLDRKLAHAR